MLNVMPDIAEKKRPDGFKWVTDALKSKTFWIVGWHLIIAISKFLRTMAPYIFYGTPSRPGIGK